MTGRRLRGAGAAWAWAVLLLAGCATHPPPGGPQPWTSGKLSVRIEALDNRPAQNLPATFDLRGSSADGELRLTSPLGSLIASARWSDRQAVLVTTQGEREFADLDALSREVLGEPLPLRALPDWIAGRPWPGAAIDRRDASGFDQLGWTIDLTRFAQGSLTATRPAPPVVVLRVRIEPAG